MIRSMSPAFNRLPSLVMDKILNYLNDPMTLTCMVMARPNGVINSSKDTCDGSCRVGPRPNPCNNGCHCVVEWAGFGSCKGSDA
ncbi:unnamed protein product [Rotaria sordida]|uniref:Uncharacterized protein n=1 Tax=Rotaria sordida TaxID=392033 RepID=A0A819NH82_9BILA|nr:unnamed protein product [Rotaria sordida]CAF3962802.1 unnamed protein product [Rotaria sordida]CAF3997007.1 unnamed protein product [Rotaria sordida]